LAINAKRFRSNAGMKFEAINLMKFIILLLLLYVSVHGAFDVDTPSASVHAMGCAVVAMPANPFALSSNPANIINNQANLAVSCRNFYNLPQINQIEINTNLQPLGYPVSLTLSRFGNKLYQEIAIGIGLAYQPISAMNFGFSLNFYSLSIENYGMDHTIGLNLGIAYRLFEQFHLGAKIANINRPVIGRTREKLPQYFRLGLFFTPLHPFTIAAEIFRDVRYTMDYRIGLSYKFDLPIIIRIGIRDDVNSYCFGFGMQLQSFNIDYAVKIHTMLGVSHLLSLIINI